MGNEDNGVLLTITNKSPKIIKIVAVMHYWIKTSSFLLSLQNYPVIPVPKKTPWSEGAHGCSISVQLPIIASSIRCSFLRDMRRWGPVSFSLPFEKHSVHQRRWLIEVRATGRRGVKAVAYVRKMIVRLFQSTAQLISGRSRDPCVAVMPATAHFLV